MGRFDSVSDYSPTEVAALLRVSPSTLRYYAVRFNQFLSAGAQGEVTSGDRGFRHRRYTADDVDILRRVKHMLEAGWSSRLVIGELGGTVPPRSFRRRRLRARSPEAKPVVVSGEPDTTGGDGFPNHAPPVPINDQLVAVAESAPPRSDVLEGLLSELVTRTAHLEERLESFEWRLRELRAELVALRASQPVRERPRWLAWILGG